MDRIPQSFGETLHSSTHKAGNNSIYTIVPVGSWKGGVFQVRNRVNYCDSQQVANAAARGVPNG